MEQIIEQTAPPIAIGMPCVGCGKGTALRAFGGHCVDCALTRVHPFDPENDSALDHNKDPHAEVARVLAAELDLTDERNFAMVLVLASAVDDFDGMTTIGRRIARKLNQQISAKVDAMTPEELAASVASRSKCVDCRGIATEREVKGVPTLCWDCQTADWAEPVRNGPTREPIGWPPC